MSKGKNPIAKELRTPKFRSRTVKNKKVYTRKPKNVHEYNDEEQRAEVFLPPYKLRNTDY